MRLCTLHRASSRAARRAAALVAALVLTGAVASGCTSHPKITPLLGKRVDVIVTTDGGRHLVIRHNLRLTQGMTALDALRGVADVRLGPGGIVAEVNGLGGGRLRTFGPEQSGWFYRVNGIEADKDPANFRIDPGTSLWWDLRRFDIYQRVPIAIGAFPEPLFSGYRDNRRPLRIAYGTGFQKDAEFFRDSIFKQLNPEVQPIQDNGSGLFGGSAGADAQAGKPVAHVAVRKSRTNMVIGRWEEIRLDPYIADIGFDPRKYGLTVWIEGHDVRRQRVTEEFSTVLPNADGIVFASTIDGEPDSPIVLVVTGVTDAGVRAAARALSAGAFQFALAGAVDADGKVL